MTKKTVRLTDRDKKKAACKACEKNQFVKENPAVAVNCRAEVHTCRFIYKPPESVRPPIAQNATLGVKFAMGRRILDDWHLLGGTKWSRTLFRLRHPIIYSKRGLRNLYRRIKRFFFGEPPAIMCRRWVTKEEIVKEYPNEKETYHGTD